MTRHVAKGPARSHRAHQWQPDGYTACGLYAVTWPYVTARSYLPCARCQVAA